ncbi:prenyltransferase/squalene oxidase repeat-containing protein [Streptomyces phytohabitans]|uniref:prenyltransferase/squalene oxidase repeat-containing protein n=1 Tax=Streptomyces phytohabitans TaxID=1150371 RepID=UPI00345BEA0D
MSSLRRGTAVLAASVLCTAAAPLALTGTASAAPATSPARAAAAEDDGLYGKGDPKFDGVWRQSVALLAQDTAGVSPADRAVTWLTDQQCANGSFTAYRADPRADCDGKTPADTNATAAAVQALAALGGRSDAVRSAAKWLVSVRNEDGGWGYNPGSPTDANSTGVVIGALAVSGGDPAKPGEPSAYEALLGLQLGCDAKEGERGAFAYQPDKKGDLAPNDDATAAAVLAARGGGLVVEPAEDDGETPAPTDCGTDSGSGGGGEEGADEKISPDAAAGAGAAYLTEVLRANGRHLPSAMPGEKGKPDYGNTADAVLALAASGHDDTAEDTLDWLEDHAKDWDKSASDPAALGALVLAAHAADGDPRDFGGADLVKRLNATGPAPAKDAPPEEDDDKDDDGDGAGTAVTVSLVVAGLAAGAGIGILFSGRRKQQGL